jgi:manganese oxidase
MLVAAVLSLVGLGAVGISGTMPPVRSPVALAQYNDNTRSAGTMVRGEHVLALEIRRAEWAPLGPGKGTVAVYAFAEAGGTPVLPGPMLRVRAGTSMRIRVTNVADTVMVVHGLSGRQQPVLDSLVLAPGESGEGRFAADAEGSYFYWAAKAGTAFNDRVYEDSQLNGAFIVDPVGTATVPADRVFVLTRWVQSRTPDGAPDVSQEIFAINGRPWPHTERLHYEVGDSVRWRILNANDDVHPLHLHGFYFRVDARGDVARDTVYWAAQRRMAVTERVLPGTTMQIVFSPERPGGWVFHCHLNWHVVANPPIGEFKIPTKDRDSELMKPHGAHDPNNHVERGMGGLMLAVDIATPEGYRINEVPRRQVHLHVTQGQVRPDVGQPRYAYVLQDGAAPAADSIQSPGSTLVLTKGEPVAIWVHNRTAQPTQVHWHGLEIESPFDGVVGVGGLQSKRTSAIMPGDSFEVRMTPPRAGSFMYHTHIDEVLQHSGGLWGALLVMEPGAGWDSMRDLIFQVGEGPDFEGILNGVTIQPTHELQSGVPYRFRLMNIGMGTPNVEFHLTRNGVPTRWTPIAKDGFDLPGHQRRLVPSRQAVSIGETVDAEAVLAPGDYVFEVRAGTTGTMLAKAPIQVRTWQDSAQQVASAVLALPEPMREGATVLGYRPGAKGLVLLRKGTNGMLCLADDPAEPAFHVACYHESMEPFMARGRALRAEGIVGAQVDSVRFREVAEGKLKVPTAPAALWQLNGAPGSFDAATNTVKDARSLYVIYIPFATTQTTGISSKPTPGEPWLMFPGTPKAHIMFVPSM